ncbi:Prokaryotic cytochrome b561 [Fragilaria crotonensis]|nr:Prokaryotic cytochrome b561 [Fragilaria crotonensis]
MLPYAAQAYTRVAASFHWMVAIPLIGCVGTVLKAQQAPKEDKGYWMYTHKSLGLLTAIVVAPRLVYRVYNRSPTKLKKCRARQLLKPSRPKPFIMASADDAQKKTYGEIAKNSFKLHKQIEPMESTWFHFTLVGRPAFGTRPRHLHPHQPIPHWTWSLNRYDVHLLFLPISELSLL